jgi:hypothetical protein
MTPEEFVIWLKGFVVASSHYNLTPAAWDKLREELSKVQSSNRQEDDDYDDNGISWPRENHGLD